MVGQNVTVYGSWCTWRNMEETARATTLMGEDVKKPIALQCVWMDHSRSRAKFQSYAGIQLRERATQYRFFHAQRYWCYNLDSVQKDNPARQYFLHR